MNTWMEGGDANDSKEKKEKKKKIGEEGRGLGGGSTMGEGEEGERWEERERIFVRRKREDCE
jgi:hypothetical protein